MLMARILFNLALLADPSFEADAPGSFPQDWVSRTPGGAAAEVVDSVHYDPGNEPTGQSLKVGQYSDGIVHRSPFQGKLYSWIAFAGMVRGNAGAHFVATMVDYNVDGPYGAAPLYIHSHYATITIAETDVWQPFFIPVYLGSYEKAADPDAEVLMTTEEIYVELAAISGNGAPLYFDHLFLGELVEFEAIQFLRNSYMLSTPTEINRIGTDIGLSKFKVEPISPQAAFSKAAQSFESVDGGDLGSRVNLRTGVVHAGDHVEEYVYEGLGSQPWYIGTRSFDHSWRQFSEAFHSGERFAFWRDADDWTNQGFHFATCVGKDSRQIPQGGEAYKLDLEFECLETSN